MRYLSKAQADDILRIANRYGWVARVEMQSTNKYIVVVEGYKYADVVFGSKGGV